MRKFLLIGSGILLLVLLAYASWYSYNRQAKIVQTDQCEYQLTHPESSPKMRAPDGTLVPVMTPCVIRVTPPSLLDLVRGRIAFTDVPERMRVNPYTFWDVLLGEYTVSPNIDLPCDQSATTTDCALLVAQQPPPTQPDAATREKVGNFSFELQPGWRLTGFGWEQAGVPGAYNISIPTDSEESHVYIFTQPSPLGSINPSAKTLDDYRTDYPISASSSRQVLVKAQPTTVEVNPQVRVLSSEDVTINGIPMLKQRYSVGFWSLDANGNRVFDVSDEASVNDELRYVFFDGKTFVVITGWQPDPFIEQVVQSVHLSLK